MMKNLPQLSLLVDHIELSLLERQRAVALDLDTTSHDDEINRSLDSLREGLEVRPKTGSMQDTQQNSKLWEQYQSLYAKFHGPNKSPSPRNDPSDSSLSSEVSGAPGHVSSSRHFKGRDRPTSPKFVRFSDAPENCNSSAIFKPYTDEPDVPDHSTLDNQQIHTYHTRVLREQDEQIDVLGASVGRQRELSIEIGNELDDQANMLDDVDEHVTHHQTQIARARSRMGAITRKAKDNLQLTTIFILVVILILLIALLR